MSQGKIILMACGSFNPPTPMHLRMFELARDYIHSLGTHKVIGGILSPVHDSYGKKDLVSANHRLNMLHLALKSSDWIKVSDWEINQEGWTKTRVSLQYHQDVVNNFVNGSSKKLQPPSWLPDEIINTCLNNNSGSDFMDNVNFMHDRNINLMNGRNETVQVKLICGGDLLESFATPGLWADEDITNILTQHGLVVITRSGTDPDKFVYESDLLTKLRRHIIPITNWVPNEISSTAVRRLLRRAHSVRYLIQDSIISYIQANGLYGVQLEQQNGTEYSWLTSLLIPSADTSKSVSPNDVAMVSPDITAPNTPLSRDTSSTIKNIVISIRDTPSILDQNVVSAKRSRKSSFIASIHSSRTDLVAPIRGSVPRIAYDDAGSVTVPGKAVKIIKDWSGPRTVLTDDGGEKVCNDAQSELLHLGDSDFGLSVSTTNGIDEMAERTCRLSVDDAIAGESRRDSYSTRDCDDVVKLVLTKHGIQVISDVEAIV